MRVQNSVVRLVAPLLLSLLALAGCTPAPVTLKTIGSECALDADCGQMSCRYGKCTRACTKQGECPAGFDCGLQKPEDGQAGGMGATCYKGNWDATPVAMGGFGADCAVYSPDPLTGTACDTNAKSPCAAGFTCNAKLRCDPAAYCTKTCAADADCPPGMFCGTDTGKKCTADADCNMGEACKAPPGGTDAYKLCTKPSVCMKRSQCHACGVDDQCPAGYACAVDTTGAKFCGRICTTNEQCPQPYVGENANPVSNQFEKCVPAFDGAPVAVCRPTAGACAGPSAIPSLSTKNGTVCSHCRPGVPADCPAGFCYQGEFDIESFCSVQCTAHITRVKGPDGYNIYEASNDTCPEGSHCYGAASCASCDIKGYCTGDNTKPNVNDFPGPWTSLTCYPYTP